MPNEEDGSVYDNGISPYLFFLLIILRTFGSKTSLQSLILHKHSITFTLTESFEHVIFIYFYTFNLPTNNFMCFHYKSSKIWGWTHIWLDCFFSSRSYIICCQNTWKHSLSYGLMWDKAFKNSSKLCICSGYRLAVEL